MPLYQLVLSFPADVGDTPPTLKLMYDASDPGAMAANPTWPDTSFVLPDGLIRIWRRADTALDRSAAEPGWSGELQGDWCIRRCVVGWRRGGAGAGGRGGDAGER